MSKSQKPLLILLVGYGVYGTVYLCRYNLTVAGAYWEAGGLLNASQYGYIGGLFSLTYAVGRVFNGYIGNRLSARFMICCGILLAGLTNVVIGLAPAYATIMILWAVNGFAQSMIWGPLLNAVTMAFAEKRKSYVASLLVSSVSTGSMLGILAASLASAHLGVAWAFLLPGFAGLLAGLAAFCCFSENPGRRTPPSAHTESAFPWKSLSLLLAVAFLHGCIKDNVSYWAALFFLNTYHIDIQALTGFIFMVPALGLAGRLAYPLLYRLCKEREHAVSMLGFGVCVLASLWLCLTPSAPVAAVLLCLIAAAVALVNTSLLSIYPLRYAGSNRVSSVTGLLDFATYSGAGLSSLVYGRILSLSGMRFGWMFASWSILSLVSIFVLGPLNRNAKSARSCLE